ncbi:fimbrial protein [Pseudomonas putida]
MHFTLASLAPIFPHPLPPFRDGHILKTNVEGIGVVVHLRYPFDGLWVNGAKPDNGHSFIPFTATAAHNLGGGMELGMMDHLITLVKTGDIEPGVHVIDAPLAHGTLSFNNIGDMFFLSLSATVIQPGCQIIGDPVTPNPVELGDWDRADFTGRGFTTTTQALRIKLSGCQSDPSNPSNVSLELSPTDGSQILDPDKGLFSLNNGSNDAGLAIQLVKDDGSPMPLGRELPMQVLGTGDMELKLGAHFYQTEATVKAGEATGAVNFTLRFR